MDRTGLRVAAVGSTLSIVIAGIAEIALSQSASAWSITAVVLTLVLPSLLVLFLPNRLLPLARGIAIGQAAFACPMLFFLALLGLARLDDVRGNVEVWILIAGQSCLGLVGFRTKQSDVPPRQHHSFWMTCGVIFGLCFIPLIAFRDKVSHSQADPAAIARVLGSLERYSSAHGGQFPASLHDLQLDQGPSSLLPFSESGYSERGEIRYRPSPLQNGRIESFSLLLGHSGFFGTFKQDGYIDKLAIIHFTLEPHAPDANLPVKYNASVPLHAWLDCVVNYATAAGGPAPDNLDALQRPAGPCWVEWNDIGKFFQMTPGYRFEYHRDPPAAGRPPFAFHIVARPWGYGETGVRNYYANESGIIRGTPEDREATRNDPPIPECEWHEHTLCPPKP